LRPETATAEALARVGPFAMGDAAVDESEQPNNPTRRPDRVKDSKGVRRDMGE
jgi:hypothetical protein